MPRGGFDDLRAPAVTEGQNEGQAVVAGQGRFGFAQLFLDEFRQAVNLADGFEADIVAVQFADFRFEEPRQVLHEGIDFLFGAVPVFDGKGVKCQIFNSRLAGGADDGADGFDAVAMAFDAGQMALLGPAPVAVHDNGHVGGDGGFGLGA